jgi:hypothetical protein
MLSDGVDRLVKADPANFGQTADLVVANLDGMLADHESQIAKVNAKMTKFGIKDVASWLAIGSIEITAAATGMPLYGLLALAGNQLLDVPKLRDFPKLIRELVEESRSVRSSPVGLLFQHRR